MAEPKWTFIPDVLEEHLDQLGFLWSQRQSGLRSPDYTVRAFLELEERIVGHLQGVYTVGAGALPLLEERLASDDPDEVFAAGFSLLHLDTSEHAPRIVKMLATAEGDLVGALRDALAYAPIHDHLARFWSLLDSPNSVVAVASAEILARHSALKLTANQLQDFLRHESAEVRQAGWRLVARLQARVEPKSYAAALRDDDAGVKHAALTAGAWCGEPGILSFARHVAGSPNPADPEALYLLAVLGAPEDVPLLLRVVALEELGPPRFRVLGAWGHPGSIEAFVLPALSHPDPATAAAAGSAFDKLIGISVESDERAPVKSEGEEEDDFDAEFQEEVTLPDPAAAQREWDRLKPQLGQASRLCRGFDVGRSLDNESCLRLDMESRWEAFVRARYQGTWSGSSLNLEHFPQPR